jgi:hypothetical protein
MFKLSVVLCELGPSPEEAAIGHWPTLRPG